MTGLIIILLLMYIISLLFGYVLAFSQATQTIGKSISSDDIAAGFQDAITPPWFTKLAACTYLLTTGGCIFCLYRFGSLAVVGFFIVFHLNRIIISKIDSNHFRNLIIHSMSNRYTDYIKDGDRPRASAIGDLLERLGAHVHAA